MEFSKLLKKALGKNNETLPSGGFIKDNYLNEFLTFYEDELSKEDKKEIDRLVNFYYIYTNPLLLIKEKEQECDIMGDYEESIKSITHNIAWSNFICIIIISIIENIVETKDGEDFIEFLSKNTPIKNKKELKKLSKDHGEKNPGYQRKVILFYEENLKGKEKKKLIEEYRATEKEFKSIKKVVGDIYGKVRSNFVHQTGLNHIKNTPSGYIFEREEDILKIRNNFDSSDFVVLSWKCIFRKFGFDG